jgi:beta-galactosidase
VSTPQYGTNSEYTSTGDITITKVGSNTTNIWVARQTDFTSFGSTNYKLTLPTSQGQITIPQLNGTLTINGRDSKLHVSDYDVGGVNMLYSSAEVFTW